MALRQKTDGEDNSAKVLDGDDSEGREVALTLPGQWNARGRKEGGRTQTYQYFRAPIGDGGW